jgi:hypothetical protein
MNTLGAVLFVSIIGVPLAAQWLDYKTPGIPRLPDGKPNLSAPTPRSPDGKPDLSGLWFMRYSVEVLLNNFLDNLKPSAEALVKQRSENWFRDDPSTFKCLPRGPGAFFGGLPAGGEAQIVQSAGAIALLYADLEYRRIFMDGRQLPKDPNPTFMGYSVGRWEGDTLVVESNGFNDRTTLGQDGAPHTDALRITERYRRPDFGHMELEISFEDPGAFISSWTLPVKAVFRADNDMLEYVCNENEKDFIHIIGKTSDDLKYAVKVAPEVLAQYVGTYELTSPFPFILKVYVAAGDLMIDKLSAIPLSETAFSWNGERLEFFKDTEGKVPYLTWATPEGPAKAFRRAEAK